MLRPWILILVLFSTISAAPQLWAGVVYVNNRTGDDLNDGTSPAIATFGAGPVRSLVRARTLAGPGDTIEIANTGDVYYGSLELVGGRHSGIRPLPFVVNGNGAVIDGTAPVDPDAWELVGGELWRLSPPQKGWYRLVRGDVAVPEVPTAEGGFPSPPAGRWTAWRGSIYYRGEPDEIPANEPYRLAVRDAGVFLYGVRNVIVRDLTLRHFRLDGVNVHDLSTDVVLENLVCEDNGRGGLFVGGSSEVVVRGGALRGNREASLLIRERGVADVRETVLDVPPVVRD